MFCPSTVLLGTNMGSNTSKAYWPNPTATDNSDTGVNIVHTKGPQLESRLLAGKYALVYMATDKTGNAARDCSFDVIVRGIDAIRVNPLHW